MHGPVRISDENVNWYQMLERCCHVCRFRFERSGRPRKFAAGKLSVVFERKEPMSDDECALDWSCQSLHEETRMTFQ